MFPSLCAKPSGQSFRSQLSILSGPISPRFRVPNLSHAHRVHLDVNASPRRSLSMSNLSSYADQFVVRAATRPPPRKPPLQRQQFHLQRLIANQATSNAYKYSQGSRGLVPWSSLN